MGVLIVIEGDEFSGKTTVSRLVAQALKAHWTFEPTHSPEGLKVRELNKLGRSDEALEYAITDRQGHLAEIFTHLRQGTPVVCDRYYLSMAVFQCLPGVPAANWVMAVPAFYRKYCSVLQPHVTFVLDVTPETQRQRALQRPDGDSWIASWSNERYALANIFLPVTRVSDVGTPQRKADHILSRIYGYFPMLEDHS